MGFRQNPALAWWAEALKNQTEAEQAIEPVIASLGRRYRCQHPQIGYKYRLDFALLDDMICIEVDDDSHNDPAKRKKDAARTKALMGLGWRVLRCTNAEALFDPHGTVTRLLAPYGLAPSAAPPAASVGATSAPRPRGD